MAEIRVNATGELKLYDSDDSNYVSFKSGGTVSSNVTWTLPTADGSNGQVLTTNGSGTLSWATSSSADPSSADGDSLGTASAEWSDLFLADGGIIKFGNDQDITLTHVADTGLTLNGTFTAANSMLINGSTPTLTIGDAGAEDTKIVFDGNAQDFHIGLDDSADDLVIGLGSSLGTTAHIICDEAGHVTMPLQPCFCATPGGSDINVNSNDHTVQFSVERFDLNADYNTGTYTFTAPVTGKYFMSMMFSHQDIVDNYCKVDFVSSNKTYTTYHEAGENSPINTMHYHAVIDMDASDTVYVNVNTEDDTNWNIRANEGQFSGYLVA